MKYIIAICALFLFACNNKKNQPKATNIAKNQSTFDVKKFAGVFYDTLPCADCPGIATQLYLKPDYSFVMEQNYLDRGIVYDLGKWSVTDSILKLMSNEGPRQFKIMNHAAIKLLDNEGRIIYDSTNARLKLDRINTPFKPLQPIPVEGLFSAVGDTMNMLICTIGNSYPVALAPSAAGLKAAYNKAAGKQKQSIYTKLKGHFELRPALNDTSTKDFFVVEKFIKFLPGQQCK